MIVESVVDLAKQYLFTGILLVFVIVGIIVIYYLTVGKRKDKEHKGINWKHLIWLFVFLCYVFLVFCATMFNRGGEVEQSTANPLFYSYKIAWYWWLKTERRNIILNYIMFVPLGILLPTGYKFFRYFYRTALAGVLFSLFIEITQRFFKIGYFEVDDIVNNTAGAMIGYGLFVIAFAVYSRITNQEKVSTLRIVLTNIPLVVALGIFMAFVLAYTGKELGQNTNRYAVPYDHSLFKISGVEFTDESLRYYPVYISEIIDKDETLRRAPLIFKQYGKSEKIDNAVYNDSMAIFYPEGHNASLWIKYSGGTYEYTNFTNSLEEAVLFPTDDVKAVMHFYGFDIVESATSLEKYNGVCSFRFKMVEYADRIWDGRIDVSLCEDMTIKEVDYELYPLTYYKDFEAISPAEAYRMLKEGRFKRFGKDYLDINVISCDLGYSVDTKGFYQPNYRFLVDLNGNRTFIYIPALKE